VNGESESSCLVFTPSEASTRIKPWSVPDD
jgi:hypothetical protein